MDHVQIFFPVFALMPLVAVVLAYVGVGRVVAVRKRAVSPRYYKLFKQGEEPDHLIAARRNVANLFETPVIFYVVCIVAFVTDTVDRTTVLMAWAYVVARYLHSAVHLTYNNVLHRLSVFVVSVIVLVSLSVNVFLAILAK